MKCGVILPLNEMRDEITKNYFYWTLSIHLSINQSINPLNTDKWSGIDNLRWFRTIPLKKFLYNLPLKSNKGHNLLKSVFPQIIQVSLLKEEY